MKIQFSRASEKIWSHFFSRFFEIETLVNDCSEGSRPVNGSPDSQHSASGLCIQTAHHPLTQTQQIFTWPCSIAWLGPGKARTGLCAVLCMPMTEVGLRLGGLAAWKQGPHLIFSQHQGFLPHTVLQPSSTLRNFWKLLQLDSTWLSLDVFAKIRFVLTFRTSAVGHIRQQVYAMMRNVSGLL